MKKLDINIAKINFYKELLKIFSLKVLYFIFAMMYIIIYILNKIFNLNLTKGLSRMWYWFREIYGFMPSFQ
jgi:hypothetical protein